ncbi:venom carboxylesterase-6-like [Oppia nitens]|uniref:venom carboxylesterase-6-like n=1 Tax=Oppia nitens TaxID=1686743 RepID=UPI0023DBB66D|nr:venom carboxylesterase-6-like [Oppia nitens]
MFNKMNCWIKFSKLVIHTAIIVTFFAAIYECVNFDYNNPIAQTLYGQVRGKPYTLPATGTGFNKQVIAFIGIPYSRPPTGYDRFNPPRNPDSWSPDIKDCTGNRVMCPQVEQRFEYTLSETILESEDCLQLNIYAPIYSNQFTVQLPVLVYFHGGEFKYGGKDFFKPDQLLESSLSDGNGIIIITVNYRLGPLGFISADDINIPGNNGIRDQLQALRWISENIGSFNGNSNNVTIMGHDAGAISVSMHVLNQEAWPFFQSAVSIGGTVFTPWAFKDNPKDQAMNFGSFFGCDIRTDKLLDCLRNQDWSALMGKSRDRDMDRNYEPYWFRPVVDRNVSSSAILKDWPLNLYQNSLFKPCPYVLGFTKDEGTLEFYLQKARVDNRQTNEEKIAFLIRPFLKEWASEDIIASAIYYQYFARNQSRVNVALNPDPMGNLAPGMNNRLSYGVLPNNRNPAPYQGSMSNVNTQYQGGTMEFQNDKILSEMLGDFLYLAPTDYVARLHSAMGGKVWLFAFEYEGSKSFGPMQIKATPISRPAYGVTHMDDTFYVLPNEYSRDNPVQDAQLTKWYTGLFVTLSKLNTIPTGYGSSTVFNWRQYTPQTPSYLLIFQRAGIMPTFKEARNPLEGYRTQQADFFNGFIYKLQDKTKVYPSPFPYSEFKGYRAATWSLFGFIVLLLVIIIALAAVLCFKRRKTNELKLLRRNDKEMEERFNTTDYSENERL